MFIIHHRVMVLSITCLLFSACSGGEAAKPSSSSSGDMGSSSISSSVSTSSVMSSVSSSSSQQSSSSMSSASSASSSVSSSLSSSSISSSVSSSSKSSSSTSSSSGSVCSASGASSSSIGTGTLNHVSFTNTPALPNGYSVGEWVNGETRLVKDNSACGSGELFAFMWADSGNSACPVNSLYLITSNNNGQSWNYVACHTNPTYQIQAMTQDSAGYVHAIAWQGTNDSGTYLRIMPRYSNGRISDFAVVATFGLPNHNRLSQQLRADIKIVKSNTNTETLMYELNIGTVITASHLRDIKSYMSYAKNLTPAGSSDFMKMDGTGSGDTLVFDSCTYPGAYCTDTAAVAPFSNHVHTALFSQNQQNKDIYLFQGPIEADWGESYGGAADWVTYTHLATASGSGWIISDNGTIDTNVDTTPGLSYAPALLSATSGSGNAWVMISDPKNGVRFGRIDGSNQYHEMASPESQSDRSGWGAFNVSADDSKIWTMWYTLSSSCLQAGTSVACGSPSIAQAYYDGSQWTLYPDPIVSNIFSITAQYSGGMAGVSGWTNGVAGLLLNSHGTFGSPEQPVVATIWSN